MARSPVRYGERKRPENRSGRLRSPYRTACRPVHAFANPYRGQNDDQSQAAVRGGNVSVESFCRNLSPARRRADCALRTSDILIIWPVEILFALISSASDFLHRAQAAAARYGAGIAILNGGGDGSGKSNRSAAERFMALREAAAAKASTVFPDAERKEHRCPHGCLHSGASLKRN